MAAITSLILVVAISILITRVATSALVLTGTSRGLAQFQARSAYTGVGFTTDEAEAVVRHPVRRRIILTLMLMGNAGIATVVATLILGFVDQPSSRDVAVRAAFLLAGLAVLWVGTTIDRLNRLLSRLIEGALSRWTRLEVQDLARVLNISGPFSIQEIRVRDDDWLAGSPLSDLDLADEGILVLGIRRGSGEFFGAPTGEARLQPGDTVVLYGRDEAVERLSERGRGAAGDLEHQEAAEEQRRVEEEERARDPQDRDEPPER